ncbi:MAG: acyltransferase [Terracidiphilus sp.]
MTKEAEPAATVPEPAVTSRFDGIDLLRGLSIIAVILLHGQIRLLFTYGSSIRNLLPQQLMRIVFWQGGNGVTVFFAISGFLITLTSLRRFGSLARMRARTFYRIRFARIAPLLFLLLVVLSVLHLLAVDGFHINPVRGTLPRALFAAFTFQINWYEAVHGYLPANWDVMWSLSVEEMFYLFFPLACLALLRWKRGMPLFVLVLLALVATGPFARTVWTTNAIWKDTSYLCGMSGIALGCLTALLTDWLQRRKPPWASGRLLPAIQIAGAALMLLIVVWPPWHWMNMLGRSGTDDTLLGLATCLIMLGSVLRGHKGSAWTAPVRWFGRHSYEVYLTHEFVVVGMTELYVKVHRASPLIWIAAEVALAAPLGWAVAKWYSEPMNRRLRGAAAPRAAGHPHKSKRDAAPGSGN